MKREKVVPVIDDLPLWSAPFGLKLLDVIKYKENIKVLDIGSGLGFPLIEVAGRLGNSCEVIGIDPWKEGIERIKAKIDAWEMTNVKIIEGEAEKLPFENDYFDLIISNNGINNVEDDRKVLEEINRTAKTGCQLVVTVNMPDTMMEFYSLYENVLAKYGKLEEIMYMKEHIFHKRKPLEYTKNLVEQNGFKINSVFEDSFNLRFNSGSVMFKHPLIEFAFIDEWKKIVDKNDRGFIFKELEKELNNLSSQSNGLLLTIPWICIDSAKT
ncbi:MAG: class I SAM-dependent methyltransferase [Ignavibacteria bacterium]|jgi:ubiquinone/menaquinone biosynthesis C-methylase UbiE